MLGIVLAGGKSNRMGKDKANLLLENLPLLARQVEKLNAVVGERNVIISGDYPNYSHVIDKVPNLGPLGGISSIVEHFPEAKYFLFLPVDMPVFTKISLEYLAQISLNDSSYNCWSFENHPMPLLIKNHPELRNILEELTSASGRKCSVWRLCELLKYFPVNTKNINKNDFSNINTKEEWEKFHHEYSNKF